MMRYLRLTGLWENQQKDGTPYFSGNIGMFKFTILKNANSDNPPWILSLGIPDKNDLSSTTSESDSDLPF